MNKLKTLFDRDIIPGAALPAAHKWRRLISRLKVVCFVKRQKQLVSFGPATIQLRRARPSVLLDEQVWSKELNDMLLAKCVRCRTIKNEGLRCSLMLRDELKTLESQLGDGYYNKALIHFVKTAGFASSSSVAPILRSLAPRGQIKPSKHVISSFKECVSRVAQSFLGDLGYTEETAQEILISGMALYLDERFSYSTRVALGWTS